MAGARGDASSFQSIDGSSDRQSGNISMSYIRGHEEGEDDDRRLIVGSVSSSL